MANKEATPEQILGAMAAPVPVQEPTLQEKLAELQYRKLAKEMGDSEQADHERKNARLIIAKNLEMNRQRQEATQNFCPHKKPNGQPSIAGQRDHNHDYIFICAYCAKTFNQHTLPAHLRIPAEWIGGPE
jgi:hypothetical protein